jgi:large subunit ribosomal protein L2
MLKSYKPKTNGTRNKRSLVATKVTRSKPEKSLITPLKGPAGRSNGRISVRHKSRGAKKFYRIIDFKRDKLNIPAKVAAIEYDPNRGPLIALLHYADGEKRYILAPEGLQVGAMILSGDNIEFTPGNTTKLSKIPSGTVIHCIELNPGQGASMVRGAGNFGTLLAKEGNFAQIKLPSGEFKKVSLECFATIGVLSNQDVRNIRLGKAGTNRHKGVRPSVRGVAMANPSDHPHAGSYKDNGIGMPSPKSPWGWKTRGVKTRSRRHTNKFIVKDRRK